MPKIETKPEVKSVYKEMLQGEKQYFEKPMGVQCGVIKEEASAVEAIINMGEYAFIELGPVTIDPQHQPSVRT